MQITLPLFSSLLWMVLAFSLSGYTVAQETICINGTCYAVGKPTSAPPLMPVANATAKATVQATRSIVEVAIPPYPQVQQCVATRSYQYQYTQRRSAIYRGPIRRLFGIR